MVLGKKIETLRLERNWSREDLAAALEESSQAVACWEQGKSLPELDRLIHISMIFEVPLESLLEGLTGIYDLEEKEDPVRAAQKRRKDRILLGLKLFGVLLVILLAVIVNLIWLRFWLRLR